MAFKLTRRAKALLNQTNIKVQIIVEIDGFENTAIFGAVDVEKLVTIGEDELTIGSFIIGGTIKDGFSKPYIDPKGEGIKIAQQILPDKGGTGSFPSIKLKFIDPNEELAKLFQPGNIVTDILSTKARVYIGFQNGAHPEDSIPILNGQISLSFFGPGFVKLQISHPDKLRNRKLFIKTESELLAGIGSGDVSLTLKDSTNALTPVDMLRTFLKIEDELIEYTTLIGDIYSGLIRGALGTIAVAHPIDTTAENFYLLREEAPFMALKLLFSGPIKDFKTNLDVINIVDIAPLISVGNAIRFNETDFQTRYGLSEGDKISLSGAANPANNFIDRNIISFVQFDGGSYVIVDGAALISETDSPALAALSSQYNVIQQAGAGCNLSPEQVDVERFLFWIDLFEGTFPEYEFQLIDTINAKEFIDKEVFFPANMYNVPRKGKISVQMNIPPLALEDVITLDINNVLNPDKIGIERSTDKYFYNTVKYLFGFNAIEDRFVNRDTRISGDSLTRFPNLGIKDLVIASKGLRKEIDAANVITSNSRRLTDRYRFGAALIKGVKTLYKVGFPLEVGDSIVVDGRSLKLKDIEKGSSEEFEPRLFEIINATQIHGKGSVTLDLLDTGFGLDARLGVVGPSSELDAGSTTTELKLKKSFGTTATQVERDKWTNYIGEKVKIYNNDRTFEHERTLKSFDLTRENVVIIDPALPSAPSEDFILDMPDYSGDATTKALWKNLHVFVCPVFDVVTGIDDKTFTVSVADALNIFVGARLRVMDPTFTTISERREVIDVSGVTITVDDTLGVIPSPGDHVRPVGFSDDNGLPYNYL